MQKFEINNPEALRIINDFRSGALFKPFVAKLKKLKIYFVIVGVGLFLLTFVLIGKQLSSRVVTSGYIPPSLEIEAKPTQATAISSYSSLKDEIFLFSTDLPDPVIPNISNSIDLKPESF